MIPVKLTIEGLYSYQERQVIDFSKLTEGGLFGIFGAVGSGKSSILEAITFVLYGNSDRLGGTGFAYNMMNLNSNKLFLELEFINFENRTFKMVREYRRNSKNFETVTNYDTTLYEWKSNNWEPAPSLDIKNVVGLSSENFRKTIIIPQGQFKAFLELGATDRTKMMKEIFNLHKYDLHDNVKRLESTNTAALNRVQGILQGFETVSEEIIEDHQNLLKTEEANYEAVEKEYTTVNESLQRLKALKSDFESLKTKKSEFEELNNQKANNDQLQADVERYEKVLNAFQQLFIDQQRLEKVQQEDTNALAQEQRESARIKEQIDELTLQLQAIQKDFESLNEKRKEENDLQFILQILDFNQDIEKLKARTAKGLLEVEKVQQTQQLLEQQIKDAVIELQALSQSRLDAQVIMAVGNWFTKNQSIQDNIINQYKKIEELSRQHSDFIKQLEAENITISTFEADFKTDLEVLVQQKKVLEQQKNDCEVQQKLAQYAHDLHDGQECPLCGSLEHPHIVEIQDVSAKLTQIKSEIQNIEVAQEQVQKRFNKIQQIISQLKSKNEQIAQETATLNEMEQQLKAHVKLFVWSDFNSNDFDGFQVKKEQFTTVEKAIEQKNNNLTSLRTHLDKLRADGDKFQKALESFKLEEAEKSAQINQNLSNLKVLKFESFETRTVEDVQRQLEDLKAFNLIIEKDYHQYQADLNSLNPQLAAHNNAIQWLEKQLDTHNSALQQLQIALKNALAQTQIATVEEVHLILGQKLDVPSVRKRLQDFNIQYETLKNSITELEHKLADVSFEEEVYEQQEIAFQQMASQLKEANELVINRKSEIARLLKAFEEKKEIIASQEKLKRRAENLKKFQDMFKGAGFVNYVSSIYLKQLCENANVRFHRMTKNQLSLQMSANNAFEIVDYLNGGKTRSVKTLSGGQAFQVSLSLALALAESVQSSSKADRNFFFIDEGFGTQDADAVNIVFETLNNLRKENRIVGIISHVDELKERMPISLHVVKHEDKGSIIQ